MVGRFDDKVVATFNMKDEKTRRSFVDELDEYIREVSEILTQPEQDLNNCLSYHMLYDPHDRKVDH